jgi:hypothetical protein
MAEARRQSGDEVDADVRLIPFRDREWSKQSVFAFLVRFGLAADLTGFDVFGDGVGYTRPEEESLNSLVRFIASCMAEGRGVVELSHNRSSERSIVWDEKLVVDLEEVVLDGEGGYLETKAISEQVYGNSALARPFSGDDSL